ncbi:MAG: hypothetical protein S4CHLAM102_00330 [Chlamydiia bacterium]|nr:hypothetical protein [Chlamydiia bacterium]
MSNPLKRTPKYYNGIYPPEKTLGDLLPYALRKIEQRRSSPNELVLKAWDEVIGPKFALCARAKSFKEGVLLVLVKSAAVNHMLSMQEKPRLMKEIQRKVPSVKLRNIVFRMG